MSVIFFSYSLLNKAQYLDHAFGITDRRRYPGIWNGDHHNYRRHVGNAQSVQQRQSSDSFVCALYVHGVSL